MTTVLDNKISRPALHAFVIGVGYYRHLTGGSDPRVPDSWDLRQVVEPRLSARAVLDWLTGDYAHPATVPLGSLEVLISLPKDHDQYLGHNVDEATLPHVQTAVDRWFTRCDSNPGNVALFYFCGHGMFRDNQYLLLEDFGERMLDPMAKSIDLDRFRDGMALCEADTQIFIADACRTLPWERSKLPGQIWGASLLERTWGGNTDRNAPILLATDKDGDAYGPPGDVTYYTKALLAALRGAGAVDPELNDHWAVWHHRLASTVQQLLKDPDSEFHPAGAEEPQVPTDTGGCHDFLMACVDHPPIVPVRIDCGAVNGARLQLSSVLRKQRHFNVPGVNPWRIAGVPAHHAYELATYPVRTPPGWTRPVPILPPLPRFPA